MHRFFADQSRIKDGIITITGPDVNHIKNVLRIRKGEQITVACGNGWEYICELTDPEEHGPSAGHFAGPSAVLAAGPEQTIYARIIDAQKPAKELPSRITLLQCLPKGDKMELVIQKAVELGVFEVIPVASARCVVKLDNKKAAAKIKRWNAIAESAAKQSKRMFVPEVREPLSLADAIEYLKEQETEIKLIPYECAEGMRRTRKLLSGIRPGQSVAVLIGPEGGFEEKEVQAAVEGGFESISLGGRILRTETAGLCVLSALMLQLDEMP